MEKQKDPDCKCHCPDFDLDFRNCSYWPCCPSRCECRCRCECGCNCCRNRCRKKLCDDDFSIRLAGLTEGLNYRLYQLLWFNVKIELENGQSVFGKIIYVGSNFIELLLPLGDGDSIEDDIDVEEEAKTQEDFEEKSNLHGNREHIKGSTLIFSIDKILSVETASI